ncbi:3-keto-5-aminohexanoate cleavage protein [Streptomyces phyllanthi]|uniref:3-keto-5-aminohexanoate cleavage protein n=1 Tax=Streptomyces phyllanthi TaxID=1803180 RepID=UPI0031ECC8B5
MMQVCLNGARGAGDGAVVPLSPGALAESAAEAVAAGASDVHVHIKSPCGQDTWSARAVAATVVEIRSRVCVPVGVAGGSWADPAPAARLERVRSWEVLPDHASVNWHEPGAEEIAAALLERGIGVEACIRSGTDAAERFTASPLAPHVLRVRAEVTDPSADTAEGSARALLAELGGALPQALGSARAGRDPHRPVLLHGAEGGAWPVLRLAGRLGLATRTGLADTLVLPDGERAVSNARLVAEGLAQYRRSLRSGQGSASAPARVARP